MGSCLVLALCCVACRAPAPAPRVVPEVAAAPPAEQLVALTGFVVQAELAAADLEGSVLWRYASATGLGRWQAPGTRPGRVRVEVGPLVSGFEARWLAQQTPHARFVRRDGFVPGHAPAPVAQLALAAVEPGSHLDAAERLALEGIGQVWRVSLTHTHSGAPQRVLVLERADDTLVVLDRREWPVDDVYLNPEGTVLWRATDGSLAVGDVFLVGRGTGAFEEALAWRELREPPATGIELPGFAAYGSSEVELRVLRAAVDADGRVTWFQTPLRLRTDGMLLAAPTVELGAAAELAP